MVEYYDPKRKALIKITRKGKPSKAKKKMYRKNRLSQLGQLQQTMMADIVFTRGMSSKDPDKAPIDQRERILAAREQEKLMNANLQALTAAVQALVSEKTNPQAEKEFISIATQSDLITPEDILMSDRDQIGADVFDRAVLNSTKKERLKLLSQKNSALNVFSGDKINREKAEKLIGVKTASVDAIYSFLTSEKGREVFPILNSYRFLRDSFDPEQEKPDMTQEEIDYYKDPSVIRGAASYEAVMRRQPGPT